MRAALIVIVTLIVGFIVAGCEQADDAIAVYDAPKDSQLSQPPPAPPPAPPERVEVPLPPGVASWDVPADWLGQPERPMRLATFKTSPAPAAPEVIVSQFPPTVLADLVGNINRFRNMVGLPPVADAKDVPPEKLKLADGREADAYDFTGADQPVQRVRIVMLPSPDAQIVWFFRLQGPADEVAKVQPEFDSFVQSIRFQQ